MAGPCRGPGREADGSWREAVHPDRDAYLAEIRRRTGRSILHELDDREIARLVDVLADRLPAGEPVVETDRWTLWTGALPS